MVVLGPDPVAAERARDLLARAPGAGVDDRSASVDRAEATEDAAKPLLGVLGVLDVVAEVRPVDARAHHLEPPPERLRDRVRVRGRGRRRHPEHGRRAELVECPSDEEVVGPEVVTPHADAVHLVDHDEPDADAAQRAHERLLPKALGRGVEDPRPAGGDPFEARRRVARLERGVDERRRRSDLGRQLVDLILHQGDQRGEDERGRGPEHRGELVGQRLAGARGHHGERVAARERRPHDLLLAGPELGEPEVLAERGREILARHPNECTAGIGTPL